MSGLVCDRSLPAKGAFNMTENRNGECCDHRDHREQSQQGSPTPVGAIEETFRISAGIRVVFGNDARVDLISHQIL